MVLSFIGKLQHYPSPLHKLHNDTHKKKDYAEEPPKSFFFPAKRILLPFFTNANVKNHEKLNTRSKRWEFVILVCVRERGGGERICSIL